MNYFVSLLSAPTDADWLECKRRALITIGKQPINPKIVDITIPYFTERCKSAFCESPCRKMPICLYERS